MCNFAFCQINIVIYNKMQAYLVFISVVCVLLLFYYGYSFKKRKEKQIGEDIEYMIEQGDWDGVCRILRKQLMLWGALMVAIVAFVVYGIVTSDVIPYGRIIAAALIVWRFYKLVDLYLTARQNSRL